MTCQKQGDKRAVSVSTGDKFWKVFFHCQNFLLHYDQFINRCVSETRVRKNFWKEDLLWKVNYPGQNYDPWSCFHSPGLQYATDITSLLRPSSIWNDEINKTATYFSIKSSILFINNGLSSATLWFKIRKVQCSEYCSLIAYSLWAQNAHHPIDGCRILCALVTDMLCIYY